MEATAKLKWNIQRLENDPNFKTVNIRKMVKASQGMFQAGDEIRYNCNLVKQPETVNEQVKLEEAPTNA